MNDTSSEPTNGIAQTIISGAADQAAAVADNALGLAETKAEKYIFEHLFGTVRGEAFFAVLTGNATVQTAVTAANLKAVTWLEAISVRILEPTLFSAMKKVGLT